MDPKRDEIVVFRQFDNTIEANIARTKLDAHGIPCFLTGENFSNLYPALPLTALKVRLHIFAADREKATRILDDSVPESETTE